MKKIYLAFTALVLIAVCIIGAYQHNKKADYWTHKTFEGTVVDIWTKQHDTVFSISFSDSRSNKNFIIDENTIYAIDFAIGDKVVIECDYNMNEHNGTDVPYPAIMVTDPSITDK